MAKYTRNKTSQMLFQVDATSSGSQILAGCTNDRNGLLYTGLLPESKAGQVLYAIVAAATRKEIARMLDAGELAQDDGTINPVWDRHADESDDLAITIAVCKSPVMVSLYGAALSSRATSIQQALQEQSNDAEFLTQGHCYKLAQIIESAMAVAIPGVYALNKWLEEAGAATASFMKGNGLDNIELRNGAHTWLVGARAPAAFAEFVEADEATYCTEQGTLSRMTVGGVDNFVFTEWDTDYRSVASGFSPNAVHSIDSAIIHKAITLLDAQGIQALPIHDCIAAPATNVRDVKEAFILAYAEVVSSNPMMTIYEQLVELGVEIGEPPVAADPAHLAHLWELDLDEDLGTGITLAFN